MPEIEAPLAAWESFYVIVGSSAAALTGLTFVVITLLADAGPRSSNASGIATYITPTIFHFCVALLVSALLSAPWHGMGGLSAALGISAVCGFGYTAIVLARARGMTAGYKPVLEDWMWHAVFPFIAYLAVGVSAYLLRSQTVLALFMIGAATLLLLFIGIHNAWDTVTYVTIARIEREAKQGGAREDAAPK